MGKKSLADLATDKPEEIVAELEGRDPVVLDQPEPSKEPAAEKPEAEHPEGEGPEAEKAEEQPTQEPAKAEAPAEKPASLLERLKSAHGIDHTFKDEDEVLKHYVHLRRKLSERDEEAALGRYLLENGVQTSDLEAFLETKKGPKGKSSSSAQGWNPPHEWDESWESQITRATGEDGEVVYKGPSEIVRKVQEHEAYAQAYWTRAMRNPRRLLQDFADDIRRESRTELLKAKGEQDYTSFMKENGEFIAANREKIAGLVNQGWSPLNAVEHVRVLAENEGLKTKTNGEAAKKADLAEAAKRGVHRAAAAASPIKKIRDLARLPTAKALEILLAEKGEDIPAEF